MQICARIFASAILTVVGLALSPTAEANGRVWSGIAPSFERPLEPPAARGSVGSNEHKVPSCCEC